MTIAQLQKKDYLFDADEAVTDRYVPKPFEKVRMMYLLEELLEPWRL